MAVLVEGISVVVRRSAIDAKLDGGWTRFVEDVPNATLCMDDDLARVGFLSPDEVGAFIDHLEQQGLTFVLDGRFQDMAVVDQLRGPTLPVDWLEYAQFPYGEDGGKVAACWLFEGPRMGAGIHMPQGGVDIATPRGWDYEDSLSAKFDFVPTEQVPSRLRFLRHEGGVDVFLDTVTGKEVYGGGTES
jgi:hypothetical protein